MSEVEQLSLFPKPGFFRIVMKSGGVLSQWYGYERDIILHNEECHNIASYTAVPEKMRYVPS